LKPFDDDDHEAKAVVKLWLEGVSEGEVAKRLKLRIVGVYRILDEVAARVLSPASLRRQTARDILRLDKLEVDWLPASSTNIQAALLITRVKEQRRIAAERHTPLRIDLTADVRPALSGGRRLLRWLIGFLLRIRSGG
jgi:hypothetical protein